MTELKKCALYISHKIKKSAGFIGYEIKENTELAEHEAGLHDVKSVFNKVNEAL
jgi:hypothetical protein